MIANYKVLDTARSIRSCLCMTIGMEHAEMVRHYQPMKCQKYTSDQLLTAVRSVKEHCMKLPVAAEKYHVPLSTLYDHTKERVTKIGAEHPPSSPRRKKEDSSHSSGVARDGI